MDSNVYATRHGCRHDFLAEVSPIHGVNIRLDLLTEFSLACSDLDALFAHSFLSGFGWDEGITSYTPTSEILAYTTIDV